MNKLLTCTALGLFALSALDSAYAVPLKARKVITGAEHACAVLRDRSIKCWGSNATGQLGLGDQQDRGDDAGEMGNALPFVDLGAGVEVRQLALGRDHSCALFDSNSVKCWGDNQYGQPGLGDTDNRGDEPGEMGALLPLVLITPDRGISSLVAGTDHTCALLDDGAVKCWGRNEYGQLGLGNTDNYGDGWVEFPTFVQVDLGPGRTAVQITAGYAHTCALLDNETIKCWGYNDDGQLGISSTAERGNAPFEMGAYLQAVDLGAYSGQPIHVSAGTRHTCALTDTGHIKCWGLNEDGQLGAGHANNIGDDVFEMGNLLQSADMDFTFEPVSDVIAGGFHTCALGADGVNCWGMNLVGQQGGGSGNNDDIGDDWWEMGTSTALRVDLGNATPSQLDAGWLFSCARFLNERIKCWGYNAYGQLGLGDEVNRGINAADMGTALPYLDLGNDGLRESP